MNEDNVLDQNMQVELDDLLGRMADNDLAFIMMMCKDVPTDSMIHMQALTNANAEPSMEQIEANYKLLGLRRLSETTYDDTLHQLNERLDVQIGEILALAHAEAATE